MSISLNDLSGILEAEKNWKDMGGVKENTRAATIMKIVYALAKEPLTKEGIHRTVHIHKGKDILPKALQLAKNNNIIFEHKPGFKVTSLDSPLKTKAYGYTYYLLNWSHPSTENYFGVCRDHKPQGWSGYYYSERLKMEELGFGKDTDRGLLESEAEHKERLQKLATFDPKTFDLIGHDAIILIKKRKNALLIEYPDAQPSVLVNITKNVILDTFIHFKIQEIIPKNRYPNDKVFYTYVDLWKHLEKEGLLDFLH